MAFNIPRSFRSIPVLTGATVLGVAGAGYYASRKPLLLDSAQNAPSKTLSFPRSMLFSQQLTVTRVEQVNYDTKRITFELPGGSSAISGVTPGAAILTQHTPAGRWWFVLRPYTPVHDLDERGILQLLVKKYPQGKASTYMHSLEPGQKLTVRGPIPGYAWTPSKTQRNLLLVAGGAGITPIFSLIKGILGNAEDQTRIQLIWGVNGTRDIVLKDELEGLEKRWPDRLQVTYVVSGPEGKAEAPSLGDERKYKKGYVDRVVLQEAIKECEHGSWGDEKGTKVFLCGPPGMETAIAGQGGILGELGVERKKVHRF